MARRHFALLLKLCLQGLDPLDKLTVVAFCIFSLAKIDIVAVVSELHEAGRFVLTFMEFNDHVGSKLRCVHTVKTANGLILPFLCQAFCAGQVEDAQEGLNVRHVPEHKGHL